MAKAKKKSPKEIAAEEAKLETQRKAFKFLRQRFQSQQPFTRADLQAASGWTLKSLDIYISKQLKDLLEEIGTQQYRVTETFANYSTWPKFRSVVSQVRRLITEYKETQYRAVAIYEFYLPLRHETTLKRVLDSLFYRDAIESRMKTVPLATLKSEIQPTEGENDEQYFQRVVDFAGKTFTGYSFYQVNGRFRAGNIRTIEDALKIQTAGERYLDDETTAVVRFVFPCDPDDAMAIEHLFARLFISAIKKLVAGEDMIWMVESGLNNRVHVWEAEKEKTDEEPKTQKAPN